MRTWPHELPMAALLLLPTGLAAAGPSATPPPAPKHILFVIADDLRPTLGTYGTQAITPTLDALARRGVTFTRAYTQFPWCSPSRQSFMSGRRPDTTMAWTFTTSFRDSTRSPDAIALPQVSCLVLLAVRLPAAAAAAAAAAATAAAAAARPPGLRI
jgi:hypothetical protein